ncbi:MAG: dTDP-4-dehydrorhamnose reductase [Chlamydiae bacterium]|nr:dTDP-4-dehydrorhamnose reductase [Chlamydiota bacterium]
MKVWILGAGGLLGRALVLACRKARIPYIASTRKEVDITNLSALREMAAAHPSTHLINCAAFTDVDGAEKEPEKAYAVNATGCENLGIIAKEYSMRMVHISTDYVFSGDQETPYLETDTPAPLGVYGKSKLEGEERLQAVLPTCCIVRTSWLFGSQGKNFLSRVLHHLNAHEELHVDSDQRGRVTYCMDLAAALLDISCHSGIYHFANEGAVSRFEIARDMHRHARLRGIPLKCEDVIPAPSQAFPSGAPRPRYSVLNTEKIERVLGKKVRHWKDVIPEYLLYVEKTPE